MEELGLDLILISFWTGLCSKLGATLINWSSSNAVHSSPLREKSVVTVPMQVIKENIERKGSVMLNKYSQTS